MRKLLHGLFGLCRSLVLVTAGAGVLASALAGPRCHGAPCWIWLLDTLRPYPDIAMVIAAGILVLEVFYLLTRPSRHAEDVIDFKGRGGAITIRLQSVADHLMWIADEYDDILSLEPALMRRKKSVDVELTIRVRDGANVPDLCRSLQDRVRQTIAGHVGPFKVREVRIKVDELVRKVDDARDVTPNAAAEEDEGLTRGVDAE